MEVYIVYKEFLKDVQRKNSKTLSAKKGELRLHKAYSTRAGAVMEVIALAPSDEYVYKIKEVIIK